MLCDENVCLRDGCGLCELCANYYLIIINMICDNTAHGCGRNNLHIFWDQKIFVSFFGIRSFVIWQFAGRIYWFNLEKNIRVEIIWGRFEAKTSEIKLVEMKQGLMKFKNSLFLGFFVFPQNDQIFRIFSISFEFFLQILYFCLQQNFLLI